MPKIDLHKRLEEKEKRMKLLEQEYMMTIGQIKELRELIEEQEGKKEDK